MTPAACSAGTDPGARLRPRLRPAAHALLALVLVIAGVGIARAQSWEWRLPPQLPAPAVPADNPMSRAKVDLGRQLFSDQRLSVSGMHSCASCHDSQRAFSDGQVVPRGATGEKLARNAPSIVYSAWNPALNWDAPGAATLESQMLIPMFGTHPVELGMAGIESRVEALLASDAAYGDAFRAAFPDERQPVTLANAVRALASFQRTLATADSPFDRYVFGDEREALGAAARAGMTLFFSERAGCAACHGGITFAGPVRSAATPAAQARFAANGHQGQTRPVLRVPSLRNVAVTAPYMHDGALPTLAAVIEHYDRGGEGVLEPLHLTDEEKASLEAFLESLTDRPFEHGRR